MTKSLELVKDTWAPSNQPNLVLQRYAIIRDGKEVGSLTTNDPITLGYFRWLCDLVKKANEPPPSSPPPQSPSPPTTPTPVPRQPPPPELPTMERTAEVPTEHTST